MTEEQYNKYNEALKSIREYDGIPPIEDLIERPDFPLVPEMSCDRFPKPPSVETMTDLRKRAEEYAKSIILEHRNKFLLDEDDMYYALAEAFEQGWISCDTKDEQPETPDEYSNEAPDCRYFSDDCCAKGLPGTPCERKGCMAYYPKEREER